MESIFRRSLGRLVAATLEQRWNDALERVEDVESRIRDEELKATSRNPACIEEFEGLADDLATVLQRSLELTRGRSPEVIHSRRSQPGMGAFLV